jgi:hypothetical protein
MDSLAFSNVHYKWHDRHVMEAKVGMSAKVVLAEVGGLLQDRLRLCWELSQPSPILSGHVLVYSILCLMDFWEYSDNCEFVLIFVLFSTVLFY